MILLLSNFVVQYKDIIKPLLRQSRNMHTSSVTISAYIIYLVRLYLHLFVKRGGANIFSSCVPYAASFSELSIFDCSLRYSLSFISLTFLVRLNRHYLYYLHTISVKAHGLMCPAKSFKVVYQVRI